MPWPVPGRLKLGRPARVIRGHGPGSGSYLEADGGTAGPVGGGTHLAAQRELLEMMGCTGKGSAARLAEIIAGFALALDFSTVSAAVSGYFASAHERLGRNRLAR
ncbi:hypothetical protein [Streptomyces roseochromogenus]|uniref:hypothetical protein n=1 Tax=Streptomyces roseochromogenus TaxID=285450 RepID=UPI00247681D8|nr:hypothetical protein [Streptomyces roseochromogenus]